MSIESDSGTDEVTRQRIAPADIAEAVEAARSRSARLVVLQGVNAGHRVAVRDQAIIGRSADCDVRLEDRLASRQHCRITHTNGMYVLEDLESSNGTLVNGRKATNRQVLHYGDRIGVGNAVVLFALDDPQEAQLEHRERLQALGELGAGVAHDFNNLLAVIRAAGEFLAGAPGETRLDDLEVRAAVNDLLEASAQARDATSRLLGFAESGGGAHTELDLSAVVTHTLEIARRAFPPAIRIDSHVEEGLEVVGNARELSQVLMNLLLNGRDTLFDGGTLRVRAFAAGQADLDNTALRVGTPYILLCIEAAATQPESRTSGTFSSSARRGRSSAGLGVASAYETVRRHDGALLIESSPDSGSRVRVFLPQGAADEGPVFATMAPPPPPKASRALRALVVDDEALVRRGAKRVLQLAGHGVRDVSGGEEALDTLADDPDGYDVVLLDLHMPEMSGEETFMSIREAHPEIPIIFVSGYWEPSQQHRLTSLGAAAFVQKPFDMRELEQVMLEATRVKATPIG